MITISSPPPSIETHFLKMLMLDVRCKIRVNLYQYKTLYYMLMKCIKKELLRQLF